MAMKTNTTYLDIAPVFLDSKNLLNKNYTNDGLHLNDQGYKVWAGYLKENGYLEFYWDS